MTVTKSRAQMGIPLQWRYFGLSDDIKPTGVPVGSKFYEYNTGLTYVTPDGTNWYQKPTEQLQAVASLASDHTWSGLTTKLTAGTDLAIGNLCYVGSDGKMELTDADAAATMPGTAMATGTISEDDAGVFLLRGFIRDDTWNWTVGALLYASTTSGELTETAPSGSGDQVQAVAIALSADIIYFNPSLTMKEVT